MSSQRQYQEAAESMTQEVVEHQIVLYNDDINTFDHVINCLVEICGHDVLQAEQCALLVHYKGKCTVKSGSYEELLPQCTGLLQSGLNAEII